MKAQPGICPVCSASVVLTGGKGGYVGSGIWSGRSATGPVSGPAIETICGKCGTELVAFPTRDEFAIGHFGWESQPERDTSGTVEDLLSEIDRVSAAKPDNFEILVPLRLSFKGKPVPKDVGMAILVDRILSHGYLPDGLSEISSGTVYRYKIMNRKA
jgi:hypothetical protein